MSNVDIKLNFCSTTDIIAGTSALRYGVECPYSVLMLSCYSYYQGYIPIYIFFLFSSFSVCWRINGYILKEAQSVFCKEEVKFINQVNTILTGS